VADGVQGGQSGGCTLTGQLTSACRASSGERSRQCANLPDQNFSFTTFVFSFCARKYQKVKCAVENQISDKYLLNNRCNSEGKK
jgi:hypothetical protein